MTATKTTRIGNAMLGLVIAINVALVAGMVASANGTPNGQATAIGVAIGSFTFPPAWRWVTPHAA